MTVAQLITYLQTLPQEAECQCLEEKDGIYSCFSEWKNLEEEDLNLIDLRGNQFVKPESPNFNKIFLEIGQK